MTVFEMAKGLAVKRIGSFSLSLSLAIVTSLAGIALLGVSGWFLTGAALTTAGLAFNLFGPSALVRGLSLVRILSRYGEKMAGHDATLRFLADIRGWLFRRLIPCAPFPERQWRRGDMVSRLTADIDALDTVFLTAIGPMLTALVGGAMVTLLLAMLLPGAALIYATGFICAAIALPLLLAWASRFSGEAATIAAADLRTRVLDGIEGHSDLVTLGATTRSRREFALASSRLARSRIAQGVILSLGGTGVQLLAGATLMGVLWHGLAAYASGTPGAPVLVGLLLAVLASFEAVALLARGASRLGAAAASARRVQALAGSKAAVADPVNPIPLSAGSDVVFENVSFQYGSLRPVLSRLDLCVATGERVAILGPSGSGKSTILSLMLRLMDASSGTILVAGRDIRSVSQAALHRRIALLSQTTPVFSGTLRHNLLIGDPAATDVACWQALSAARLDNFVRSLPQGLDTWLGEAGRTLSAGQTRRLCLARVLLSPAGIIALDEPTSGLDGETEEDFLADLSAATRGRTVIIATHARLPRGAVDRILRLEEGRLIDDQCPAAATRSFLSRSSTS